jgi:hypothetical protein
MSIAPPRTNRPLKFGPNDRREFIVMNSEVELRAQNDGNGNPIYVGRSKIGTLDSESKWQIQYIEWDGNNSVTSVTWPENSLSNASAEYEFVWDDRASYTYS